MCDRQKSKQGVNSLHSSPMAGLILGICKVADFLIVYESSSNALCIFRVHTNVHLECLQKKRGARSSCYAMTITHV